MSQQNRVRFAPSPTGALHIGGVRTALYNYLFAKSTGGTFILRIEDTDQNRYVDGAEAYIIEALEWLGISFEEGPGRDGEYGPYRQSERKELYQKHTQALIDKGNAYYAFDTPEELSAARDANPNFKYGVFSRDKMINSLSLSPEDVQAKLDSGQPYTIRLKVPKDGEVVIQDIIREEVVFQTNELDDKVLMKGDGMPTYHLANIVDDHLMKITHVIRGEEWLPSTGHHVLLYQALGWEDSMPQFAHLPLILKPNGKGKLSKRDGQKLGIPVFPISWEADKPEDSFSGFREAGFMPEAVINFLAFLGWNPGTEQEIFSLKELSEVFTLDRISKSGAQFDFDKAKWYNQQYILDTSNEALLEMLRPVLNEKGIEKADEYLLGLINLMKERAVFLSDIVERGSYFFADIQEYDEKMIRKRWKPELRPQLDQLVENIENLDSFSVENLDNAVHDFMAESGLGMGQVMPALRLGLSGTMKGPGVYEMMALFGKELTVERLKAGFDLFDERHRNKV